MIEMWLIILTSMEPNVPPKLQEFVSHSCEQKIESWKAQPTTLMARCEAREHKPKEEKK